MSIDSTPKATEFAKLICNDLKILDGIQHIRSEAIDDLQGTYGDFENGFGDEEYGSIHVYAHKEFSWWFNKNLNESQKQLLLDLSENGDFFEITTHSTRRKNLILSFLFKLKRTEVNEYSHLEVNFDFPNINSDNHSIYGEMYGEISEDEISKMMMIYELKH